MTGTPLLRPGQTELEKRNGKLRGVVESYGDVKPDSAEGRLVAQMEDFIQVLQEAYSEAVMDASENYRANMGKKYHPGGWSCTGTSEKQ